MSREIVIANHKTYLYTRAEVAQILGICDRTAWKYIHSGKIPSQTIGGTQYVSDANLMRFIHGAKRRDNGHNVGEYARKDTPNPEETHFVE